MEIPSDPLCQKSINMTLGIDVAQDKYFFLLI